MKRDNTHRARLVALGYSQIPGVDFTENYAPVIDDETINLVLEGSHSMDLSGKIIDIETAFLYGDLEEDIYMIIPEGLEHFKDIPHNCCCNLLGIIYGLVQASRQFFKKFVKFLKEKLKFEHSSADPCLLTKYDPKLGQMYSMVYVDDRDIWKERSKKMDKKEVKKEFNIKEGGLIHDYLGVTMIKMSKGYLLHQKDTIDRMEKLFGLSVKDLRSYATPMAPGYTVVRSKEGEPVMEAIEQSKY